LVIDCGTLAGEPASAAVSCEPEVPMTSVSRLKVQQRARYVRAGADDLLVEGSGDSYGWVGGQLVPVRWGDFPSVPRPAWFLGRDDGGGAWPVGPNGPWVGQKSILPAVTRCTTVILALVARRSLWRFVDRDGMSLPRPLWVDDPMGSGRMPGPVGATLPSGLRLDGHSFFESWLAHAIWWGLGAFIFQEGSDGTPRSGTLRLLNPMLVGVDDDGRYVIDPRGDTPVRTGFDGQFIMGGAVWRLVAMRGLPPNDHHTPEGVLSRHFDTFRLGASVSEYVANTFKGMGVPSGLLKVSTPGFKKDDADELKASWMAAHGSGRRSVAVLNSTVDFQPLGLTPVDADSASLTRVTRTDIAHAFGLSSVWLDEGASGMTYNNNSDRRQDLVDISLAGWAETVAGTLTSVLPFGQRVEVDWNRFTRPSFAELAQPMALFLQSGVLTAAEVRAELGRAPMPGPDPAWVETSVAAGGGGDGSALGEG